MTSTRSRPIAAIAVAVACVVFVAGFEIATAHEYSAGTKATIDSGGPDGAEGKVTSTRSRCEANRKVKLFREQDGEDELFGTDRSDSDGNWAVVVSLVAGDYYVLVVRLLAGAGDHRHMCRRGRSPTVHL